MWFNRDGDGAKSAGGLTGAIGGIIPADILGTISNFGEQINDKATLIQLFPLLKKATSSSEEPTPGQVYLILIQLSFQSKKNSILLVDYLNHRLQRHSAHGVLKTLKCIRQLVDRGSREVRIRLRETDEHLKRAPDFGSQRDAFNGTALLEEIRGLSAEILNKLFDQVSIENDSSTEPESVPDFFVSTKMAGMGNNSSASSGRTQNSKYEGFGSTTADKSGGPDVTTRELLQYCLGQSTGDYEPLQLDIRFIPPSTSAAGSYGLQTLDSGTNRSAKRPEVVEHVPGKAGGGWDDEDNDGQRDGAVLLPDDGNSDEEDERFAQSFGAIALTQAHGSEDQLDKFVNDHPSPAADREALPASRSSDQIGIETTKELELIKAFCQLSPLRDHGAGGDGKGQLAVYQALVHLVDRDLAKILEKASGTSRSGRQQAEATVLFSVRHIMETEDEASRWAALLVLEKLLERGSVQPSLVKQILKHNLELCRSVSTSGSTNMTATGSSSPPADRKPPAVDLSVKAAKLLAITEHLAAKRG